MVTTESPIEELIDKYMKDIIYDAHGVDLRISRSQARVYLQSLGKKALKPIAVEMESQFLVDDNINYELFMAYVILICGIIEDHNLPESPYDSDVKYVHQDPEVWIKYCQENG